MEDNMNLFELPTLADVLLFAVAAIMTLLICDDKSLRKERKTLLSGIVCIVVGLLSIVAKLYPALCPLVLLMVGAFCLRLGFRLRYQKNRGTKQIALTEQTVPIVDAYFVDDYQR
jgi:uncharacterized membrane protein HdeD (DUF308 family)